MVPLNYVGNNSFNCIGLAFYINLKVSLREVCFSPSREVLLMCTERFFHPRLTGLRAIVLSASGLCGVVIVGVGDCIGPSSIQITFCDG